MIVGLCSSQPTDEEQTWWMDLLPNATANYSLGGTFQVGDDGLGNTGLWINALLCSFKGLLMHKFVIMVSNLI